MKQLTRYKNISAMALISFFIVGCASEPKVPTGYTQVHEKLLRLQSDPALSNEAPVAIKDAEEAVLKASRSRKDDAYGKHLVWVADRKVDIAYAQAQAKLYQDQRKDISKARDAARLESRTQEANSARLDADQAKRDADQAKREAELARKQADELQQQISELNAKTTDRGLVVTLGDLLFETDKSDLREGSETQLNKLSAFLVKYPDKGVLIEGHTDNIGADSYNQALSERRANSVRNFLLAQGVETTRITTAGKGKDFPVASNNNSSGRQMNRRVEVIITNLSGTQK